jgi:serine/threonine protein phosphatase PrpC
MGDNQVEKTASQGPARTDAEGRSPAPTLELRVAGRTDVGRARPHNEDYVDYYIPQRSHHLTRKGSLFLVADGMGGHRAGEVASRGAVKAVMERYYDEPSHDVPSSLVQAFRTANQQLHKRSQVDPTKAGMGTTLVAAVVLGRKLCVANVGDSRAYLLNREGLARITEDHSWVAEQVRAGLLTEEQARRHPQRNLVTRALGSKPSVEVDIFEGEIRPGDILVLCSDGLTNRVSDAEISAIVRRHSPEEAARLLVEEANERGGNDNISVLIASAQREPVAARLPAVAASGEMAGQRPPLQRILVALVFLLLIVAASLGAWAHFAGGRSAEPPAFASPQSPGSRASAEWATATASSASALISTRASPGGTSVPLATSQAPTPLTASRAPAPASTTTPGLPAAPVTLGQPEIGARLSGVVTFTWMHHGALEASQAFQLLVWREGQEGDFLHVSPPARQESYDLDLDEVLGGSGEDEFLWSVRIVRAGNGEPLTDKAPHRTFMYEPKGDPQP